MARYGISKEGADSMRSLASDLKKSTDDIKEGGKTLRSEISGIGDGLGIYEDQILDLVAEINLAQTKGEQAVELLLTKVNKKASDIEALVSAGLG